MKKISKPVSEMKHHYDVVVVGSGYGGSVAASRLARAGKKVCLLERGKELLPGDYPNDISSTKNQIQIDAPHAHIGPATALFDFRTNKDMNVLLGCGLGGTSLINANVALELDPRVFKDESWPQPEEGKGWPETLKPFYALGRTMLNSGAYPEDFPRLNKLVALKKSAEQMNQPFYRPPINVNFKSRVNPFGVTQKACNGCGDCCSGCNVSAKNTTLMNYLPDANNYGAEIFTETAVHHIIRAEKKWTTCISDPSKSNGEYMEVTSDVLILSAGALGSTEILLRSQSFGLPLSPMLGKHFSGNGDVLAFGYNSYWDEKEKNGTATSPALNAIGIGDNLVAKKKYPGPCITGIIDMRHTEDVKKGLVIEEGVIPGAFATGLAAGFLFGATQYDNFFQYGKADGAARLMDAQKLATAMQNSNASMTDFAYQGAVAKTQTYLVMSHDDANGEMKLQDDRIRIQWPGIGKSPVIQRDNKKILQASQAIRGQFLPNPTWTDAMGRQIITVHPVGGCRMGAHASTGVVDTRGRVFDNLDKSVHEGLYVMDGAVMPGALGVNPLLTITAFAERACYLLALERGWKIDYTLNGVDLNPVDGIKKYGTKALQDIYDSASRLTGFFHQAWDRLIEFFKHVWKWIKHQLYLLLEKIVQFFVNHYPRQLSPALSFDETMQGFATRHFQPGQTPANARISDDFEIAFKQGQAENSTMVVHLLIESENVYDTVSGDAHTAKVSGTVECGELSATPMKASGLFHLFPVSKTKVETWNMIYDMEMKSGEGKDFHFYGQKVLHQTTGSNWWYDVTTLFVNVFEKSSGDETIVAKGIIRLSLEDLMKQAATVKITTTNPVVKRLPGFVALLLDETYAQKFAAFFGMVLFRSYGGMLADLANFPAEENAHRKRRTLRAPKPEMYNIKTPDGFQIKLTRYAAGRKGPVILAPGFTVNACSFAADTVEENLVEFLCNAGTKHNNPEDNYDVWLLDYRASPDAGNNGKPFTMDDIALYDWPAAVQFVLEKTHARDVQVLAHCAGSMSFLMAKLRGLKGVRSAICSQLTLHPVTDWMNYLKADVHLVKILEESLHINTLDIRSGNSTQDKGMDALLWSLPVPEGEECKNPCCRRIFAVYGPSYTHSQLNHDTHVAMREWFGVVSTKSFEQLTTMLRLGYVVDRDGKNTYLPEVKNIDIPIHFIAGSRNQIFFPETSLRTFEWLKANVGAHLFSRQVYTDYAHMDFFIGKNASRDIFPSLWQAFEDLDQRTKRVV
jgi:cholesterol oxidase